MFNNDNMKEKIEALSKNEAFAGKVKACTTAEEICDLYAEENIMITAKELDAVLDTYFAQEKELSADDLDMAAGGFISGSAFLAGAIIYSLYALQSAYVLGKYCK